MLEMMNLINGEININDINELIVLCGIEKDKILRELDKRQTEENMYNLLQEYKVLDAAIKRFETIKLKMTLKDGRQRIM